MRAARWDGLRRIPVRTRVVVAFALGSTVVPALVAVATWNLTTGYMLQQRQQSAVRQASVNVRLVQAALGRDPDSVGDLLTGLAASPEAAIFVRQPTGWISGGTAADGIGPDDVPASLLSAAERGDIARQRLRVDGIPVVAVAMPLPGTGEEYVEVFPLRDLDRTFRFISLLLGGGVLAGGLLGATIGLWASRRALRPLTELTEAAGRVAHGDLSTRLPVRADPDLGPIAVAFNETAGDLQARVERDARFASDVSHELRSPVTTMAAAMEVLVRRRDDAAPAARRAIDLLDADLRRFRRLVEDLLEISKLDQGAFRLSAERLDLAQLAAEVVRRIRPDLRLERSGDCPVVADRRRLEQVVTNLVENAEQHGRGLQRVGVTRVGDVVRLEVDDAGPGVAAADRDRVFERFARASDRDRIVEDTGSGLGLALAAQHVRLHSGRIFVVDRPGGGARFVVELGCGRPA
ncbi:MAG TPA: HAMP domain-containing sensor histidine kinase [Mycobacteriales bacterium]|nr:HAMP domain-containing sensor histidine kinase [Mycobacteriales bacterium]